MGTTNLHASNLRALFCSLAFFTLCGNAYLSQGMILIMLVKRWSLSCVLWGLNRSILVLILLCVESDNYL